MKTNQANAHAARKSALSLMLSIWVTTLDSRKSLAKRPIVLLFRTLVKQLFVRAEQHRLHPIPLISRWQVAVILVVGILLVELMSTSLLAQQSQSVSLEGNRLLQASFLKLCQQTAISLQLKQTTHLPSRTLLGQGTYQQGKQGQFLLEMKMKLKATDSPCILRTVSDGNTLWKMTHIKEITAYQKLDLERLRNFRSDAQSPSMGPSQFAQASLAISGFPALVESLQQNFDFALVQNIQIAKQPVALFRGTWKPQRLAKQLPSQASKIQAGKPINWDDAHPLFPTEVIVKIHRQKEFPFFIQYRREVMPSLLDRLQQKEPETISKPISTIEVTGIDLSELDSSLFTIPYQDDRYQSADDVTEEYLTQLGWHETQSETTTKPAQDEKHLAQDESIHAP